MEFNFLNEFLNLTLEFLETKWVPAAVENEATLEFISAAIGYVDSAPFHWIDGNYHVKKDLIPASLNFEGSQELLYSAFGPGYIHF